MNKPVLVVMAAGMGSRYGGMKQIDPVGPNGQVIVDYSLYDARRAGFETVIFVIKHEIEEAFKKAIGDRVQLVGDDLFVTHAERLMLGAAEGAGNAILVKPNQVGTLTETLDAVRTARQVGYAVILSHRSGDTESAFLADLAVAVNADYIKSGAPCRSERLAKYNRLLAIEEELKDAAAYMEPFHKI